MLKRATIWNRLVLEYLDLQRIFCAKPSNELPTHLVV